MWDQAGPAVDGCRRPCGLVYDIVVRRGLAGGTQRGLRGNRCGGSVTVLCLWAYGGRCRSSVVVQTGPPPVAGGLCYPLLHQHVERQWACAPCQPLMKEVGKLCW